MQQTPENNLDLESARLESYVMDYVQAGWTVTDRTGIRVRLAKNDLVATLSLDEQGQVIVDGPPPPGILLTGRTKAWLTLLVILVIVFVLAWVLGYFRV